MYASLLALNTDECEVQWMDAIGAAEMCCNHVFPELISGHPRAPIGSLPLNESFRKRHWWFGRQNMSGWMDEGVRFSDAQSTGNRQTTRQFWNIVKGNLRKYPLAVRDPTQREWKDYDFAQPPTGGVASHAIPVSAEIQTIEAIANAERGWPGLFEPFTNSEQPPPELLLNTLLQDSPVFYFMHSSLVIFFWSLYLVLCLSLCQRLLSITHSSLKGCSLS